MINQILDSLQKVKQTGRGKWKALCPCHDEKTPSLSITQNDESILMYCFGCGANGTDVMKALGLNPWYLFKDYDESRNKPGINMSSLIDKIYNEGMIVFMAAKHGAASKQDQKRLNLALERLRIYKKYLDKIKKQNYTKS
jgi:hypothetical protein